MILFLDARIRGIEPFKTMSIKQYLKTVDFKLNKRIDVVPTTSSPVIYRKNTSKRSFWSRIFGGRK